ncbi:hypothetical protein NF865_02400 [Thermococcus aggregans]|uniref:Uncharacterized protein n=1 Tax=Thermococcus aggregans TaxID=110163 RepID=A0A9E7MY86_THEAG|nr:hypothetical protein [Thermococcus aggregans]USS41088.1 hypothetical protein NF865_02400 [Thermococcus aggregans]
MITSEVFCLFVSVHFNRNLPKRKPKLSEFFDIIEVEEAEEDVEKELLKDDLAGDY